MKKLRWQLIIIFLTGLVVGILLLGEQPGSLQPIEPEPARGGIYTEALVGSMQRLNPVLDFYNAVDRDVNSLIFNGLIRFDGRGVPQPDLAEAWGIARDGTVYNVALRPDLKWHDGEPLTSEDVLFTINLLKEGGDIVPKDIQEFWEMVEVNALSDTAMQFVLPEPFAPFLDYLAFGILPRHLLGDRNIQDLIDAPFNLNPIGSGPYKFNRLIVENDLIKGVALSVNEDFYGNKPFIEQVIFLYYPDSSSALEAYREGVVQGISEVDLQTLPSVLTEPDLSLYSGRKPEMSLVFLNLNNPEVPFLGELVVRQALMMGINRQWIVDRLLQGQAMIADGPILPGTWAYYDGLKRVGYEPQKAANLLKEAGYVLDGEDDIVRKKDGVTLSFELIYPDDTLHQQISESIQSDLSKIGVQVTLVALPYEEIINGRLASREYQAALVDLNLTNSPDPDPYPFWDQAQATGGQNYSQWDNRNASEFMETARVTADLGERSRLYRNFQVIFSEDQPALTLYYPIYNYAVDSEVKGVRMGPLFDTSDRFLTIRDWYLVARIPSQVELDTETPAP